MEHIFRSSLSYVVYIVVTLIPFKLTILGFRYIGHGYILKLMIFSFRCMHWLFVHLNFFSPLHVASWFSLHYAISLCRFSMYTCRLLKRICTLPNITSLVPPHFSRARTPSSLKVEHFEIRYIIRILVKGNE